MGYAYARRHATDARSSFGTGKVNSLAGFAGALLLAVFAGIMAWESLGRLLDPVTIAFNEAIAVAIVGLAVNGVSILLLDVAHDHRANTGAESTLHHDHNLRSAYLHVLADALTSVLAIVALVSGKYLGYGWMDPAMGIVGATLVTRWSLGLLRETSGVLLDRQAPEDLRRSVKEAIEVSPGDRVSDLHVWSVGTGIYAAIISVVTDDPAMASLYRERLPAGLGIVHASIEVQHCDAATP
jgi:cation diffusion facilitator family transporter